MKGGIIIANRNAQETSTVGMDLLSSSHISPAKLATDHVALPTFEALSVGLKSLAKSSKASSQIVTEVAKHSLADAIALGLYTFKLTSEEIVLALTAPEVISRDPESHLQLSRRIFETNRSNSSNFIRDVKSKVYIALINYVDLAQWIKDGAEYEQKASTLGKQASKLICDYYKVFLAKREFQLADTNLTLQEQSNAEKFLRRLDASYQQNESASAGHMIQAKLDPLVSKAWKQGAMIELLGEIHSELAASCYELIRTEVDNYVLKERVIGNQTLRAERINSLSERERERLPEDLTGYDFILTPDGNFKYELQKVSEENLPLQGKIKHFSTATINYYQGKIVVFTSPGKYFLDGKENILADLQSTERNAYVTLFNGVDVLYHLYDPFSTITRLIKNTQSFQLPYLDQQSHQIMDYGFLNGKAFASGMYRQKPFLFVDGQMQAIPKAIEPYFYSVRLLTIVNGKLTGIFSSMPQKSIPFYENSKIVHGDEIIEVPVKSEGKHSISHLTDIGGKIAYSLLDQTGSKIVCDGKLVSESLLAFKHVVEIFSCCGQLAAIVQGAGCELSVLFNNQLLPLPAEINRNNILESNSFNYNLDTDCLEIIALHGKKLTKHSFCFSKLSKLDQELLGKLEVLDVLANPTPESVKDVLNNVYHGDSRLADRELRSSQEHLVDRINRSLPSEAELWLEYLPAKDNGGPKNVEALATLLYAKEEIRHVNRHGQVILKKEHSVKMWGGDPLAIKEAKPLMSVNIKSNDFYIQNYYLHLAQGRWGEVTLPSVINPQGSFQSVKAEMKGFHPILDIPVPVGAYVEKNSLVAKPRIPTNPITGKKVPTARQAKVNFSESPLPNGSIQYQISNSAQLNFKINLPVAKPVPNHITKEEADNFLNQQLAGFEIERENYLAMSVKLPVEIKIFISELKKAGRDPLDNLILVQKYLEDICFYDYKNGETFERREMFGADNKFQFSTIRAIELRAEKVAGMKGKMFAGVCIDFAELQCAMLRELGMVAGVATGIMSEAGVLHSVNGHAETFVVWPNGAVFTLGVKTSNLPEFLKKPALAEELNHNKYVKIKSATDQFDNLLASVESHKPTLNLDNNTFNPEGLFHLPINLPAVKPFIAVFERVVSLSYSGSFPDPEKLKVQLKEDRIISTKMDNKNLSIGEYFQEIFSERSQSGRQRLAEYISNPLIQNGLNTKEKLVISAFLKIIKDLKLPETNFD